jgi:hypothetical protein
MHSLCRPHQVTWCASLAATDNRDCREGHTPGVGRDHPGLGAHTTPAFLLVIGHFPFYASVSIAEGEEKRTAHAGPLHEWCVCCCVGPCCDDQVYWTLDDDCGRRRPNMFKCTQRVSQSSAAAHTQASLTV